LASVDRQVAALFKEKWFWVASHQMFHQQNKKGKRTMKKILILAIAVLFSLVGFKYTSAATFGSGFGGNLTTLNLDVTYEEELPATATLSEGKELVTVASGIKQAYDPYLHLWFDTNGNLYTILISWLNPTNTSQRIWTVSCSGGNQNAPIPDLPNTLTGAVATKPQLSIKKPPATENSSVEGVATCYVCPDGFAFSSQGVPTDLCNGGESYGLGYMTYKGTVVKTLATGKETSISLTGTVAGAGFDYVGEEWVSKDCNTYGGTFDCTALFSGSFGATLAPCPESDPKCLNQ
jgi:hypothetical protein